jgi:hypothetical protein
MGDDAAKKGLSLAEERELVENIKNITASGKLAEYLAATEVAPALRSRIEKGFRKVRKAAGLRLSMVDGVGPKTASLLCHKEATDLVASLMVEDIKEEKEKAEAEMLAAAAKAEADRDALVARKKAAREEREKAKAMTADVNRLVGALRTSISRVQSAEIVAIPAIITDAVKQGKELASFIENNPDEDDELLSAALVAAGAVEVHASLEEAMKTAWALVDEAEAREEAREQEKARQKRKKREKARSALSRHPKAERIRHVVEGVFSRAPREAAKFLHEEGFVDLKPDRLVLQLEGAWNARSSSWTREADSILGWGLNLPEDLVKEVRVNTPAPLRQGLPLAEVKIPVQQDWIDRLAGTIAADIAALPRETIARILALQA